MFLETQQNTAKDLTPMPDQFEHYITKNIKAFYKRRLLTPILYLIFLLVLIVCACHIVHFFCFTHSNLLCFLYRIK